VLNLAVFLFEIRRCEAEAFELAKGALEDATAALAAAPAPAPTPADPASASASGGAGSDVAAADGGVRAEAEAVMALIRENLRVWGQVLKIATMAL
jgi:hypothetical protein